MKYELFVARKVIFSRDAAKSVAGPILRISMWSIVLGFIVMLVSIASSTGLQKEIQRKVVSLQGNAVVSKFNQNASYEPAPFAMTDSLIMDLNKMPQIEHIQAYSTKAGVLKTQDDFEGIVLKGVDQNYQWTEFKDYLHEGDFPNLQADSRSDELLVSKYHADRLNLAVGDKVLLYFLQPPPHKPRRIPFHISGIYHSGMEQFDQVYAVGDLNQIRRLNKWEDNEVGGIEVFLKEGHKIEEVNGELNATIPFDLISRSARQLNPQMYEWLDLFDLNVIVILAIMIAVASVNMITVLLILILDRTHMIGVFKALGSRNLGIQKIFIFQGALLLARALFLANIIGVGILLIQKYFGLVKLDEASYYVHAAPVFIDPMAILYLNLGTLIICFTVLLVPSFVISGIRPAKSLRFS